MSKLCSAVPKGHFIAYLKRVNLDSKGCNYRIVGVNESSVGSPSLHAVPIVSEFPEVFTDDLPRVLHE